MMDKSKKFIALFLVFSLMALSVNLYAKERRGATLIIQRKDGQQIKGELITVKPNSLLILDSESGADISIEVSDIKVITVVKKSRFWKGAGTGALIGGGTTLILYLLSTPKDSGGSRFFGEGFRTFVGLLAVILGGGVGGLIGGIIGATTTDKTIHFEGMTDLEIQEVMDKLRKKARIPNYK
jgi:hypothetical protein